MVALTSIYPRSSGQVFSSGEKCGLRRQRHQFGGELGRGEAADEEFLFAAGMAGDEFDLRAF